MATGYTATAGDTLLIEVTITDEDGAPLNLAGYSAIYKISTAVAGGTDLLTKTTAVAGEITLLAGGVLEIAIDAGETSAGHYYHELQITSPAGGISTVLSGYIAFEQGLIV